MLSLVFDPAAFGGAEAFAEDVARLAASVKSSPPIEAGGKVLLPGEMEEQTRKDREITGLAIDEETWRQITTTAASLGVESPKG
jgi:LDH2 family malate/lactate/ureidoglycolate dehydrogenase